MNLLIEFFKILSQAGVPMNTIQIATATIMVGPLMTFNGCFNK